MFNAQPRGISMGEESDMEEDEKAVEAEEAGEVEEANVEEVWRRWVRWRGGGSCQAFSFFCWKVKPVSGFML